MNEHKHWTVKDLKEFLSKLPEDATVFCSSYEYNGTTYPLIQAFYHETQRWGIPPNTVVLG